jgi:hypothetical protein
MFPCLLRVSAIVIARIGIVISRFGDRDHAGCGASWAAAG